MFNRIRCITLFIMSTTVLVPLTGCVTTSKPFLNVAPYKLQNVDVIWNQQQVATAIRQYKGDILSAEEVSNVHLEALGYLNEMHSQIESDLTADLAKHGVNSGGDVALVITPIKMTYDCRDHFINPFTYKNYKGPQCQGHLPNDAYFDVTLRSKSQEHPMLMWTVNVHCIQSNLTSKSSWATEITSQAINQLDKAGWFREASR